MDSAEGGRGLRPGKSCLTTTRSSRVVLAAVYERVIVVNTLLSAHGESLFVHARYAGRRMLLRRNETLECRGPIDGFLPSMTLNGLQRQAYAPRIAGRSTDASTGAKRQHHDHPFVPLRSRPQTAAPDPREFSLGVLPLLAIRRRGCRFQVIQPPRLQAPRSSLTASAYSALQTHTCSHSEATFPCRHTYVTHQE